MPLLDEDLLDGSAVPQDNTRQECFSCLSSAFFRGADPVILSFNVKQHVILCALNRQWSEFCACRPLSDEDEDEDEEMEDIVLW